MQTGKLMLIEVETSCSEEFSIVIDYEANKIPLDT